MATLQTGAVYEIELCSGERRRWQYLGAERAGEAAAIWWRDLDSGSEFNEASLMYAWTIVGPETSADAP